MEIVLFLLLSPLSVCMWRELTQKQHVWGCTIYDFINTLHSQWNLIHYYKKNQID